MDPVTVTRKSDGLFSINIRNNKIDVEFAENDGGRGISPTPSELLVGSLGSCIALMIDTYCRRQGYNDGEVGVNLTYEFGERPKRISSITVNLEIPKNIPERKIVVIKRIAKLCAVHGTLVNPPAIDVEIM